MNKGNSKNHTAVEIKAHFVERFNFVIPFIHPIRVNVFRRIVLGLRYNQTSWIAAMSISCLVTVRNSSLGFPMMQFLLAHSPPIHQLSCNKSGFFCTLAILNNLCKPILYRVWSVLEGQRFNRKLSATYNWLLGVAYFPQWVIRFAIHTCDLTGSPQDFQPRCLFELSKSKNGIYEKDNTSLSYQHGFKHCHVKCLVYDGGSHSWASFVCRSLDFNIFTQWTLLIYYKKPLHKKYTNADEVVSHNDRRKLHPNNERFVDSSQR